MKYFFIFFIFSLAGYFLSPYSILSFEDLQYTWENTKHPALSFPDTGKKFYNQWHCYKTKSLNLTTSKIEYDGWKDVPTLYLGEDDQRIEFTIDPDIDWNSSKIMTFWKELLKKSSYACLFSVHLQKGLDGEVRYIERLKTSKGMWERGDDRFTFQ